MRPLEIRARQNAWFEKNVGSRSIEVALKVDLSVKEFLHLNEEDGSFHVRLGEMQWGNAVGGGLRRRPRSAEPWEFDTTSVVQRWSTRDFDWAAWVYETPLDPDALTQLQRHLHPHEEPENQFTVDRSHEGRG